MRYDVFISLSHSLIVVQFHCIYTQVLFYNFFCVSAPARAFHTNCLTLICVALSFCVFPSLSLALFVCWWILICLWSESHVLTFQNNLLDEGLKTRPVFAQFLFDNSAYYFRFMKKEVCVCVRKQHIKHFMITKCQSLKEKLKLWLPPNNDSSIKTNPFRCKANANQIRVYADTILKWATLSAMKTAEKNDNKHI